MRPVIFFGVLSVFVLSMGSAAPLAAECPPAPNARMICADFGGPEDFAFVPGTEWILVSSYEGGTLNVMTARDQKPIQVYPMTPARARLDAKTYAACPGPIVPADKGKERTHGLYLRPGPKTVHTLYVVHHGTRESVEVFEVDAVPKPPTVTWIGCVVAPEKTTLNSVAGLPDGGFAVTNTQTVGGGDANKGENSGEVWEWQPRSGWKIVPGSEMPAPNGLEASKDGKWLYIGGFGTQTFIRLSRGETPVKKDVVPLGYRVDNLRWAPDGTLFGAGKNLAKPQTLFVDKINPNTLQVTPIVRYTLNPDLANGAVAVQVGQDVWVGTFRGEQILMFPASPSK